MKKRLLGNGRRTVAYWACWVAGGVAIVFVGWLWLEIARFFLTDHAYSQLVEGNVTTREEVERILDGFRQEVVTELDGESAPLAKHLGPNREYVRFTLLGARHGIDVVFDSQGNIVALWPDYE